MRYYAYAKAKLWRNIPELLQFFHMRVNILILQRKCGDYFESKFNLFLFLKISLKIRGRYRIELFPLYQKKNFWAVLPKRRYTVIPVNFSSYYYIYRWVAFKILCKTTNFYTKNYKVLCLRKFLKIV